MFEFTLPDLGEGVAEGEVLEWHVEPGDRIAEDDVLAEVETDKAAVDVPSPVDGVVTELRYDPGDVVAVGEVIVTIDEDGDDGGADGETGEADAGGADASETDAPADGDAADTDTAAAANSGRVFAPPNVRRLARELGVEISAVEGSGPSGRVTEADVRTAAEEAGDDGGEESAGDESDGERSDEDGPTSVVSRVGDDDGGADASAAGDDASDEGPTPAIRQVDEPTIETGDGTDDGPASDEGPAVKSAVKRAGSSAERDRTLATPKTRRVARELGVDVDAVPTEETRDGEPYVSEAAVRQYADEQRAVQADATDGAASEAGDATTGSGGDAGATVGDAGAQPTEERPTRREPYRGVRRTIGEQMARSRREVPHAVHHDVAVVPELVEARERLRPRAEDRGVELTYLPFVLKSVAAALRDHPILNTELDEDAEEIVYKEYYDIGVATATDAGLLVPVVRDVDDKRILEVAAEVNDLVARARDRSIERSEMQGGTFTVTNFGAIGGEFASPVVNVPQTAILGVGELRERAVAEDGEVVARPTLPLSLAIDHRVVDGADAARFANTLAEYLADPTLLLLE